MLLSSLFNAGDFLFVRSVLLGDTLLATSALFSETLTYDSLPSLASTHFSNVVGTHTCHLCAIYPTIHFATLILHENQRLHIRLKTLAVSGGQPRFSPSVLGKGGRRLPFELKSFKTDDVTSEKEARPCVEDRRVASIKRGAVQAP